MRLDKFLSELNIGTRSRVKEIIRSGQVTVNGSPVREPELKIDPAEDEVMLHGRKLRLRGPVCYMMNKPKGVVSAATDRREKTVASLLSPFLREEDRKRDIFPVGRLDKDTTGLLLLTDDGELAHRLLSPSRHVDKTYIADLAAPLKADARLRLEQGVDIGEKGPTLPAKVEVYEGNPCRIRLTIREGKFHQVKRMLRAVDNEVLALNRVEFGGLALDKSLLPGQCRELTETELETLRRAADMPQSSSLPLRMDGVKAVIFDLDGTLADSMWIWRQIDIEYLGKFGIPLPENLQKSIEGMSFHETAVYFKERFNIPDSLEQMKDEWNAMAWDKYEHEVPLKPGVTEFLSECRSRGILLGIATSNSRALLENIANTHRLHDYFQCILTGSDVVKGKPAPDIYLAVAEKLGVDPAHCLVFEDIIPGIQAGLNAGMKVCAVEDAYSADTRVQKQELADYYIVDYSEIQFD